MGATEWNVRKTKMKTSLEQRIQPEEKRGKYLLIFWNTNDGIHPVHKRQCSRKCKKIPFENIHWVTNDNNKDIRKIGSDEEQNL